MIVSVYAHLYWQMFTKGVVSFIFCFMWYILGVDSISWCYCM